MRGRTVLLSVSLNLSIVLAAAAAPASSRAASGSTVACANVVTTSTSSGGSPSGGPCWVDTQPYPFGSEGRAVETSNPLCKSGQLSQGADCYLTVTSMAFRAWNRGLAATESTAESGGAAVSDPFVVWLFNGTRWFPDPSFPGQSVCKGNTVVWAGKLDYWLIGPGAGNWPSLCRFDGVNFYWEPLPLPEATLEHVAEPGVTPRSLKPGGITSAACFAWNNCWFFGTYGTVVHWDGNVLSDASPTASESWLQGEYDAAVARPNQAGNESGLAVGATSEHSPTSGPLPPEPGGAPPPEMFASSGSSFSPLPFAPPTIPQLGDPYRTDLVAVDIDSEDQGWVAGNPEGYRTGFNPGPDGTPAQHRPVSSKPDLSPLVPVTVSGEPSACKGPAEGAFTYTSNTLATEPAGAFLWSSIATVPGAGSALAGGRMRPAKAGSGPNEDTFGEPVIVQANCDGTTSVTRFRVPDSTYSGSGTAPEAPADRAGTVTAIVANATNDAWAATTRGQLNVPNVAATSFFEPPHLYRLTNGQPPAAPEGDDSESRPLNLHIDPPIYVLEPPPPPPPPPPPITVTKKHRVKLKPAIYHIRAKLRGPGHLSLYLTFRLRRPVTIGAEALRHKRVVATARPKRFTKRTGQLILKLDRRHWPTAVRFIVGRR